MHTLCSNQKTPLVVTTSIESAFLAVILVEPCEAWLSLLSGAVVCITINFLQIWNIVKYKLVSMEMELQLFHFCRQILFGWFF